MRAYIASSSIGLFAVDEKGTLIESLLFENNPERIANWLHDFTQGKQIPELLELHKNLQKKYDEISIESEHDFDLGLIKEYPNLAGNYVRKNLADLCEKSDFNYPQIINDVNTTLTRIKLKEGLSKADKRIMQAVNSIDEVDDNVNVLVERLREWYALYFPEMNKLIKSHETFAKLVSGAKDKNDFDEKINALAENSVGASFSQEDIQILKTFGVQILDLYELRRSLLDYLEDLMEKEAPNTQAVAGTMVGSKLIALAGGMKRLARMPSSTVQILGAEKALFRHMETGAKPPKYGAILQHNAIQSAPRRLRGKVARLVAAKISIAVKKDYYSKEFIGDELKKELNAKVRRVMRI